MLAYLVVVASVSSVVEVVIVVVAIQVAELLLLSLRNNLATLRRHNHNQSHGH